MPAWWWTGTGWRIASQVTVFCCGMHAIPTGAGASGKSPHRVGWAEAGKTAYVVNGTVLRLRGYDRETRVSGLPRTQSHIRVKTGDVLLLVNSEEPGKAAIHDNNGELLSPGRVCLPIPEVYRDARRGETVCFDDGRIAGIIEKKDPEWLRVRITHTRRPVEKTGRW